MSIPSIESGDVFPPTSKEVCTPNRTFSQQGASSPHWRDMEITLIYVNTHQIDNRDGPGNFHIYLRQAQITMAGKEDFLF